MSADEALLEQVFTVAHVENYRGERGEKRVKHKQAAHVRCDVMAVRIDTREADDH